jgi:hypothetical protein
MSERKIVEYSVVYRPSSAIGREDLTFSDKVNKKISEGWQPYGSPQKDEVGVYQPMVRYAEPEPDNAPLQTEIERLRAVVAKFEAELGDWRDCARVDAKMSGPVLVGWNRPQLDRCWEKHIRNRPRRLDRG